MVNFTMSKEVKKYITSDVLSIEEAFQNFDSHLVDDSISKKILKAMNKIYKESKILDFEAFFQFHGNEEGTMAIFKSPAQKTDGPIRVVHGHCALMLDKILNGVRPPNKYSLHSAMYMVTIQYNPPYVFSIVSSKSGASEVQSATWISENDREFVVRMLTGKTIDEYIKEIDSGEKNK